LGEYKFGGTPPNPRQKEFWTSYQPEFAILEINDVKLIFNLIFVVSQLLLAECNSEAIYFFKIDY
jgi:hypothetical protein